MEPFNIHCKVKNMFDLAVAKICTIRFLIFTVSLTVFRLLSSNQIFLFKILNISFALWNDCRIRNILFYGHNFLHLRVTVYMWKCLKTLFTMVQLCLRSDPVYISFLSIHMLTNWCVHNHLSSYTSTYTLIF
jgi:hypothetical protein